MDHFQYKNGTLHAEGVPIPEIAAAVGTPFYVYSTATLTRHYRLFTEALSPLPHLVCFAIKSLSNVAVLKTLGNLGAGMDVVSGGEYRRARAAEGDGEQPSGGDAPALEAASEYAEILSGSRRTRPCAGFLRFGKPSEKCASARSTLPLIPKIPPPYSLQAVCR